MDEEIHVLAHDIVEPPVLHKEPEPFNGVEVGRIGRKIKRFEVVPLKGFLLVPGGIIENQDISMSGKCETLVCLIQEGLEHD
ncbi:MAG: hypothetical protein ABSH25_08490 [Syntrophorhabdales bacterium]